MKPAPATSGNRGFDVLARVIHYALNVFVFAITEVGLVFSLQTNRLQRAFFGGNPDFALQRWIQGIPLFTSGLPRNGVDEA